jgi:hypothetical protein
MPWIVGMGDGQSTAALLTAQERHCHWYPSAMADETKTTGAAGGMKSAYELALERMEREGIERPREDAVSEETRRQMEEARQTAEAKLAELEILHRDRLKKTYDPEARRQEEEDYRRERRAIEASRDDRIAKLRKQGS